MSPYSPLKVFHHQERLDFLKRGIQIVPSQVQLIISDLCNQDCHFCAYRMSGYTSNQLFGIEDPVTGLVNNNPNRMIPYPKIVEILDDCEDMGVGAVQITGGGEPTVHPQHTQIFKDVLDRGLKLAVVTNGVRLLWDSIEQLGQAAWVRISIDAGNEKTYARTRSVSEDNWTRVWNNVEQLAKYRDDNNTGLVLGIGFVVTKENWSELPKCALKAKRAGSDNIRISAVFQEEDENYFKGIYKTIKEIIHDVKRDYADNDFRVFDNFGDRYDDLEQRSPEYSFCGYQQFNTYIGADLNVYRCCVLAYNEKGKLGSLKEQTLGQFWQSELKKDKIADLDARTCPRCMFNNKNRTILYALDKNPEHVDFV